MKLKPRLEIDPDGVQGTITLPCKFTRVRLVGSRVTCRPPPEDTDIDVLVLIEDSNDAYADLYTSFRKAAWNLDGSEITVPEEHADSDHRFSSFKQGNVNAIVTSSEKFFDRFMAATAVAKRLNLLNKSDRVALFQAVLYANAEPASRAGSEAIADISRIESA